METPSGVIGDAAQRVGEPCTGIDVVEPCGDDQAVDGSSAFAAAVRAGEQPRVASDRDTAQRGSAALLVRQIPPSSRNRSSTGQCSACSPSTWRPRYVARGARSDRILDSSAPPMGLMMSRRFAMRCSTDRPLTSRSATKIASIAVLPRSQPAPWRGRREQTACAYRAPAARLNDCSWSLPFPVELVEPGIGVRLQDPRVAGQMAPRMDRCSVGRVVE